MRTPRAIIALAILLALIVPASTAASGLAGAPATASRGATLLDHDIYVPVEPPATPDEFLSETGQVSTYLANLPVETEIAKDVLEKILDLLVVNLGDEITHVLSALGININIDWSQFSMKWLLDKIHFYSYDQDAATRLLTAWASGMTPPQEESLKRLYLAEAATEVGFNAQLHMAEDASEGLFECIDLILGATRGIEHIANGLGDVPGVGQLVKKIKTKIIQRIVYGLNAAVDLATAPIAEPNRSRIRAVATTMAAVFLKWKDIEHEGGFGGISPEFVTEVGVTVLGKLTMTMAPRIGVVPQTNIALQAAADAAAHDATAGTFDAAAKKVLDDGNPQGMNAVLERVMKTSIKNAKLSKYERDAANIAGCISQVAQLVNILDPTNILRIVTIAAAGVAAATELHSVYNSVHYFYKIVPEMKAAMTLAFKPDASVATEEAAPATLKLSDARIQAVRNALVSSRDQMDVAVADLLTRCVAANPEGIDAAVDALDSAAQGFDREMSRVTAFHRSIVATDEQLDDPLGQALLAHQLGLAAANAAVLAQALSPSEANLAQVKAQLGNLQRASDSAATEGQRVLDAGLMDDGATLTMAAPGAMRMKPILQLEVVVANDGARDAEHVDLEIAAPRGYRVMSSSHVSLGTLQAGSERRVQVTLTGGAAASDRPAVAFIATSAEGLWATRLLYLTQ